jgi:protein-S-isoprenylcysteine O-methyltransferase Ste14
MRKFPGPPRGPFVPPVYFLAALGAMAILHRYWPLSRVLEPPYRYSGIIVIALSIALILWAALLFKRADTGIVPFTPATSLVAVGPYRFTRNPMYLGMAGMLLGVALLFGTLAPLVAVPIFVALIQWRFILAEEAMLATNFGQAYEDYKARVRRWL